MTIGLIFFFLLLITSLLGMWSGQQEYNKDIRTIIKEDNDKRKIKP